MGLTDLGTSSGKFFHRKEFFTFSALHNIPGRIFTQAGNGHKGRQQLSVHDLRVVPGNTHTNIVFDCLCPRALGIKKSELVEQITRKVREIDPKYNCVITVDESFTPVSF